MRKWKELIFKRKNCTAGSLQKQMAVAYKQVSWELLSNAASDDCTSRRWHFG